MDKVLIIQMSGSEFREWGPVSNPSPGETETGYPRHTGQLSQQERQPLISVRNPASESRGWSRKKPTISLCHYNHTLRCVCSCKFCKHHVSNWHRECIYMFKVNLGLCFSNAQRLKNRRRKLLSRCPFVASLIRACVHVHHEGLSPVPLTLGSPALWVAILCFQQQLSQMIIHICIPS